MQITVILCTYNRAHLLPRALESVLSQRLLEPVDWELLVVDNNSKDRTREVVADFERRYAERVRYVFEPKQGISNARNAGVENSRGAVLAFIDDDETADPDWLHNLTSRLHDGPFLGAGGPVVPQWDTRCPKWLTARNSFIMGPLALFDPGLAAGPMEEPPLGANMAFRKTAFKQYGLFRVDLGRVGDNLISNEDTEFGRRLIKAGEQLRYEPSAIVYSPVSATRLHPKYFLTWWFNKGRSDVIESGRPYEGLTVAGVPLRRAKDVLVEVIRWMFAISPSDRFVAQLKIWTYAGQAAESWRMFMSASSTRNASPTSDGRGK